MSCPQCFSGHVNPGNPLGRIETIYGRKTYVSEPPEGKAPKGIIVIIPDAFGLPFVNNQILADHYASRGQFLVYLPDFMDGKESSVNTMLNMAHATDKKTSWLWMPYYVTVIALDFIPFLIRNRVGVAWPRVTSFFKALREDKGATLPVGAAGFCWGGKHAVMLTHKNADTTTSKGQPLIDASFGAHVSSVVVPQEIESIQLPFSLAQGDEDFVMDLKQTQQVKEILANKSDLDTEVVIYPGAGHGFAVRASKAQPDSKETQQADEAEQQAVAWFQKQFQAVKHKYSALA